MSDDTPGDAAPPPMSGSEATWRADATRLSGIDYDAMLASFGKGLPPLAGEPLGALPRPGLLARRAQTWLDANRTAICRSLRESDQVRAFVVNRNRYDTVSAAVLIAGALVSHFTHTTLPFPLTLAVILARLGLEDVCGSDWGPPPGTGS